MIQRIQSVFLAFIVLIIGSLCAFNIMHLVYVGTDGFTTEYMMNLFYFKVKVNGQLTESKPQFELIMLSAIIMGFCIFTLFNFKNRIKQMRYAIISLILLLLLIIVFFVKAILFVPNFNTEKMMLNSVFGIALLLFCLYLIIRVYYLIRKDEDLVRSADRIR